MQEEPVVNPWLGDQIIRLRSVNTDAQLREMYRAAQEADPTLTWMDFLSETALHAKVKAEPSLLEPRDGFDLPVFIRERLFMNQVMVLADLAQLTRETIEGIPGFTREEKDTLYAFMERKGIPARSSSRPVFLVFYTEAREEYEKTLSHISVLLKGADEILERLGDAALEDALEQACLLYEEALRVAREDKVDLLHYEGYVRRYAGILTDYCQFGDLYREKAEQYSLEDVALCRKVYGPTHVKTGKALRKAASFLLLIDRFAEAAGHFLSSADIVKASEGDFSPEAGEDLESAAFCYEKMGMYPLALELYEQALNISLMNLGNANIHPKPIMYEISSIYYKMGDTGSAREWMDRYDSFPE